MTTEHWFELRVTDEPRKMSETLVDFARPLTDQLPADSTADELKATMTFAASVWNVVDVQGIEPRRLAVRELLVGFGKPHADPPHPRDDPISRGASATGPLLSFLGPHSGSGWPAHAAPHPFRRQGRPTGLLRGRVRGYARSRSPGPWSPPPSSPTISPPLRAR